MCFSAAVHHVQVVRCGIVSNRVRIEGNLNLLYRFEALTVVHLDRRCIPLDDEKLFEIAAVKNGVRRFRFLDRMNKLIGRSVQYQDFVILLSGEEKTMPFQIKSEVIKV